MKKSRIVYVDTIKVFLTCLVVAHHAGQAYGPTGGVWLLTDHFKADWLGQFFFINASYMMGLYFFISGYFMIFSVNRKTTAQFIYDRLIRLGIPLLFFTFFIFLPINYLSSDKSVGLISFFVDSYFNRPPIATGHLWFVASLLVYSFVYLMIFPKNSISSNSSNPKPFKIYYLFFYILFLTIVSAFVRLYFPIDVWKTWFIPLEVAHIPQYFSLFLIGTLFNRYQWLNSFKLSVGVVFLILSIVAFALLKNLPNSIISLWWVESMVESLLCVGISMSLLTFFRHFGNVTNRFLQLLSDNVYGIYLFHLIVVIAFQMSLVNLEISGNIKFIIVTILSIIVSLGISVFLRMNKYVRMVI